MVMNERMIKKIKDMGLNSYEAKIWTALLSRGVSTAGELSDIANVPRSRSYDVLESLEKKGFITMKIGKPIKYIAVKPEEVLERVKKRISEAADEQAKIMDELKDSDLLNELTSLHSQGVELVNPFDVTGAIKGSDSLMNHLDSMIKDAKKSIIICTTEDGIIKKVKNLKRNLKKAKSRGVKISIAAPRTPKTKDALAELKDIAEIKDNKDITARFCIVDDSSLAFMLMNEANVHPNYDTGVWVNTPTFGNAMVSMFNKSWQAMKPVQ